MKHAHQNVVNKLSSRLDDIVLEIGVVMESVDENIASCGWNPH